jgi:hypothetical protein
MLRPLFVEPPLLFGVVVAPEFVVVLELDPESARRIVPLVVPVLLLL